VLVLVLDTSTPAVTAALVTLDGPRLIAQRRTVDARAHGERLAPGIVEILAEAGARPAELTAIVAGLGPGPFTGLRVGLVTAAALSQALAIPAYGVCSLDGIGASTAGTAIVATDARRKEVYWAVYRGGSRITDPAVNKPGDLPDAIKDLDGPVDAVVGDGALRYADVLPWPVIGEPRYPESVELARLAAPRIRSAAPAEALTPLYLRRPDAVEPGAPKAVSR
jgi:tRNA threonylcarbamoyl adenosine modification protein YeaZ